MTFEIKNICCIGAGYVGGPTMAVIADKCPQLNVTVIDIDAEKIKKWNSEDLTQLPIYEPGLEAVIRRCRNKNLKFSTEVEKNISLADIVFISVNTPTKKTGVGAGKASDLKYVEACARQVANHSKGHTIVVEKSTLPVRTAEVIKKILEASKDYPGCESTFDVLSNPEFLSEGSAIKDLEFPDRVLIGGENSKAIEALSMIYCNWINKEKILHTNIWSSELAKLTANAFLAQRISSINAIGALCEATGADVREVARAIGTDTRIGSRFLDSGPGFGGSCFKKDILNLVYLARHFGLPEVADFWEEVVHLNIWHQHRISKLVVQKLFGTVTGKKITILGFSFKANTNDTRESASIKICKDLIKEGAKLSIHDPKVSPKQISNDLGEENIGFIKNKNEDGKNYEAEGSWNYVDDIYEGATGSDGILILTEWNEYSKVDWQKISEKMRKPAWVFDVRSIVDCGNIKKTDLNFWRIGDGANNQL